MHSARSSLQRSALTLFLLCAFAMPLSTHAANTFGGKVGAWFPCPFNFSTWSTISAPQGGLYIWTPFTKTFNGPPTPGKWAIGLYGIPYFCIVWIAPLFPLPGISMTMVGTSN